MAADWRPRPPFTWDLVAALGLVLVAASLFLPWREVQSCPIFGECGDWESEAGWQGFGVSAAVFVGGAVAAYFLIPDAIMRRIVPAAAMLPFLFALGWAADWLDFVIFGDARGPLYGFYVALAGALLILAAMAASAFRRKEAQGRPRPSSAT